LVQLYPGVYVDAERRCEEHVRRVAAVRYLDGRGALSHTTALAVWRIGWDEPPGARIHATVPPKVRLVGAKGLVLHRHRRSSPGQRRGGLTIVPLDEAVVRSWPLLPERQRIGLVISVVTGGHVTIGGLSRCMADNPRLKGASELKRLLDLVVGGCHSPLELWGALQVFTGPGMPALRRQVQVGGYRLDVYAERERVAFELDGAAFHFGAVARERDMRRDATLAALGVTVVRYSYDRLMSEPEVVRREVLAILAARSSVYKPYVRIV
jgi:very-short-patch-repair endonuclease